MRLTILALTAVLLVPGLPAEAQTPEAVPPELTLERAVELARRHSPTFLQTRNDVRVADWDVRQAWARLLPSASASSSVSWQGAGEQRFGSLTLGDLGFGGQPSYYFSNYNLGLNWDLSWSSLMEPRRARVQREAVAASVDQGSAELVARVTNAYLSWVRTPMMGATGRYDDVPAMTPDEAAEMILDGIAHRKQHVMRTEDLRRFALARVHPSGFSRIVNVLYRIYADDPDDHPELALDRAILKKLVRGRLV